MQINVEGVSVLHDVNELLHVEEVEHSEGSKDGAGYIQVLLAEFLMDLRCIAHFLHHAEDWNERCSCYLVLLLVISEI